MIVRFPRPFPGRCGLATGIVGISGKRVCGFDVTVKVSAVRCALVRPCAPSFKVCRSQAVAAPAEPGREPTETDAPPTLDGVRRRQIAVLLARPV